MVIPPVDPAIEPWAVDRARGCQAPDAASSMFLASIAISLKRIADVAEGFGDHPDNANAYGETGMRAVIGELGRFKNEVLNEVSSYLHNRR